MSVDAIAERTTVPTEDGMFTVDELTYHADRGSLSSSGARLLIPPSVPAKFKERMDNPPRPKREYDFGHLSHLEVLGKGLETVEIPADNYRTKVAQQVRNEAHATGKIPVLVGPDANEPFHAELAKARRMRDAVYAHPDAGPLFARGHAEKSLYYTDAETGVRLRARPDWLTLVDNRLWCVDYKTSNTAHPELFARKAAGYGYHCQAAWYMDAVKAVGLHESPAFVLVVCEKDAPHLVSVVEYDDEAIAEGRRRNREAIRLYAECRERDEWPGYPIGITPITLPIWAFEDEEIVIS